MKSYEHEVQQRWGNTKAYRQYKNRSHTPEQIEHFKQQQDQIYQDLFELMSKDVSEPVVQQNIHEARMLIHNTWYDCDIIMFGQLGELYQDDERYKKNIDKNREGLTDFLCQAISYYVQHHQEQPS